jgi:hypothetical protein
MDRSKYFDPSYPLTPSELFFVDVQDFKIGHKVSHWNKKWFPSLFGKAEPIRELLITAFLANEQIGSLRIETREKQTSFGFGSRLFTYVAITDTADIWPQRSLEFELHRIGASLKKKGEHQVFKIVYEWLQPRGSPFGLTFQLVMGHLCERGFLKKNVRKDLGIIHVNEYYPKEKLLRHTIEHRVQKVREMLEEYKSLRPDLWKTLLREINEAYEKRKM